jgi:acetolactate synthase-1/2/3 large subunit
MRENYAQFQSALAMLDRMIEEYTEGHQFEWESPDFATIAEGFGCRGVDVDSHGELRRAVEEGLEAEQPTLINVDILVDDPSVVDASTFESSIEFDEFD